MPTAERVVPQPVLPPPEIVLRMTEQEAEFLRDLLGWKVGGNPDSAQRKFFDAAVEALERVGVREGSEPKWARGEVTVL